MGVHGRSLDWAHRQCASLPSRQSIQGAHATSVVPMRYCLDSTLRRAVWRAGVPSSRSPAVCPHGPLLRSHTLTSGQTLYPKLLAKLNGGIKALKIIPCRHPADGWSTSGVLVTFPSLQGPWRRTGACKKLMLSPAHTLHDQYFQCVWMIGHYYVCVLQSKRWQSLCMAFCDGNAELHVR